MRRRAADSQPCSPGFSGLQTEWAQRTEQVRVAAVRLAAIVRREALEDRNLMTIVASDEPELAPALAHLCRLR